ncbi:hypothetical protein K503DRAFT_40941 [Rhizopogon vinicolor AM-OR11-026]|uniref:Uncharacterized protein n=1 Tax=Rhizopogon vinicolor AM-OR11-026 TaxID=1314800 RepID=A0A1B7MGV9_9AGAM|nr:hypothetical protein K503DRAFT_40941 [Rhizopogon vinicolor AM-OR11-026]
MGQDGVPPRLGWRSIGTKTFHHGDGKRVHEWGTSVRAVDFNFGERSWDPKRSHRYRHLIIRNISHARLLSQRVLRSPSSFPPLSPRLVLCQSRGSLGLRRSIRRGREEGP